MEDWSTTNNKKIAKKSVSLNILVSGIIVPGNFQFLEWFILYPLLLSLNPSMVWSECSKRVFLVISRKWKWQNCSTGNSQLWGGVKKKASATQKTSQCSFRGRLVNFQNTSSSPCYRPTSDFIIRTFSWTEKKKVFFCPMSCIASVLSWVETILSSNTKVQNTCDTKNWSKSLCYMVQKHLYKAPRSP